jgi:hypothetical protein
MALARGVAEAFRGNDADSLAVGRRTNTSALSRW